MHSEFGDNGGCTSVIALKPEHSIPGKFAVNPCIFDSILQLTTFVMNANDNADFQKEVYVIRGWHSAFLDEDLSKSETYETYVQMSPRDKDLAVGDISILHGGVPLGCIRGVRVQRIPRRLMDVMSRPKTVSAAPVDDSVLPPAIEAQPEIEIVGKAMAIVAEESGIPVAELKDDQELTDIEIDSLLILVIISRFRGELDLDLQPTFFMEASSIGAVKEYLRGMDDCSSLRTPETDSVDSNGDTTDTSESEDGNNVDVGLDSCKERCARNGKNSIEEGDGHVRRRPAVTTTSVILQGTPSRASKIMFLFPDCSGSASSYLNLPKADKEVAVIGINCPYMKKPSEMKGSFKDITTILLAEVRRHQPQGPYYLGGWSAGGPFAYCATQMLLAIGEKVDALVLIDAPCPIGLGKLPQIFFDFWRTIHEPGGPVADRPNPNWLMNHFQAVNSNLRGYMPRPLPPGFSPRTFMALAARGTDNLAGFKDRHLLTPEEDKDLGFMMDDKEDFGPRGWDRLLEGDLVIEKAMTSNHFTTVRSWRWREVGDGDDKACLFAVTGTSLGRLLLILFGEYVVV
jgi:acyl carrier protein/pimeloyl-ACP methyl ester carboxylesterase